jgi:DNA invertase Pin-like site-specific DNA recombinase
MGELIGYARCSTAGQDLTAQRRVLRDLGVGEPRIYLDHGLTGRNRERPGLQLALAAVREGDALVVPKLDRLARRCLTPGRSPMSSSSAEFGCSSAPRCTTHATRWGVCSSTSSRHEFEADLLSMRTREGMAVASARGRLKGKPPKLSASQQQHLLKLFDAEEKTVPELAELFSVSRATVYRVLDRHNKREPVAPSAAR